MTNQTREITTAQVCVLVRGGLELWINKDRVPALEKALEDSSKKFIRINDQLVNPFEVLGVFTPDAIEDRSRRKNGQWKCMKGKWHEKDMGCGCEVRTEVVTGKLPDGTVITYSR